jgi:hypothetical protein
LFKKGGEFVPFPLFDDDFEKLLTETFRRLVLDALVKAHGLSVAIRDQLSPVSTRCGRVPPSS